MWRALPCVGAKVLSGFTHDKREITSYYSIYIRTLHTYKSSACEHGMDRGSCVAHVVCNRCGNQSQTRQHLLQSARPVELLLLPTCAGGSVTQTGCPRKACVYTNTCTTADSKLASHSIHNTHTHTSGQCATDYNRQTGYTL